MTNEEAVKRIEELEEKMRILQMRVSTMMEIQEQLDEVDERTQHIKRPKQTSHVDG